MRIRKCTLSKKSQVNIWARKSQQQQQQNIIAGGTLMVNLENKINLETINSICETYKELLEIDKDFKTTVEIGRASCRERVSSPV